jgi:hypothetical protein
MREPHPTSAIQIGVESSLARTTGLVLAVAPILLRPVSEGSWLNVADSRLRADNGVRWGRVWTPPLWVQMSAFQSANTNSEQSANGQIRSFVRHATECLRRGLLCTRKRVGTEGNVPD